MTSKEFVLWFKGFTEGVHEFAITPKQWDYLKEKLAEVSDETHIGTAIGGGWGTPNGTITTTPGTGFGSISIYNPSSITHSTGSTWSYTTSNDKIF